MFPLVCIPYGALTKLVLWCVFFISIHNQHCFTMCTTGFPLWENIILDKSLNFIYLFGVLRRFQHCTGHITMGSWKGRGNQYIQFITSRVQYCKLPTNGKQLPAFPLEAQTGIEPRPQRWEARVLPLCHRGPDKSLKSFNII